MKTLLTFLAGMILGSALMLLIIALCIMASEDDKRHDRQLKHTEDEP